MANPFFSWNCPRSFWKVVGNHLPLTLVTGIPLLLAGWLPLRYLPLMKCTFLQWTGYPCPFCGFTRSFWALAEGNWIWAFSNCPLSVMVYTITLGVFFWNCTALLLGIDLERGPWLGLTTHRSRWITIAIIILLFTLNWIYRLKNGLQ
jgi:hypothetical protein